MSFSLAPNSRVTGILSEILKKATRLWASNRRKHPFLRTPLNNLNKCGYPPENYVINGRFPLPMNALFPPLTQFISVNPLQLVTDFDHFGSFLFLL